MLEIYFGEIPPPDAGSTEDFKIVLRRTDKTLADCQKIYGVLYAEATQGGVLLISHFWCFLCGFRLLEVCFQKLLASVGDNFAFVECDSLDNAKVPWEKLNFRLNKK